MALDRYGDVLPQSILKPRSAGEGNPVYVALSFADEHALVTLQEDLRASGIKAEWQDPGLFHCSLLVVQDATDEQLNGLLDDLSLPVRFWAEVASLGTFEADDIPLIANVVANPSLIRLQQEFEAAALRLHLPVFEFFRATAWKPHITLGYDSDADIEALPPIPAIIKLRAEAVLLMRDDYNVVRRILLPETAPDRAFVEAGGKGSGFYGHAGRPGEVGGSLLRGEVGEEATPTSSDLVRMVAADLKRRYGTDTIRPDMAGPRFIDPQGNILLTGATHYEGLIWALRETEVGARLANSGLPMSDDPSGAMVQVIAQGLLRFDVMPRGGSLPPVIGIQGPDHLSRPQMAVLQDMVAIWPRADVETETTSEATQGRPIRREPSWLNTLRLWGIVERHYGPDAHPGTGTPQSVHGGGGISGEARLVSGIGPRRARSRARYKPVIAADGITALAGMPQTQTWQPVWEGLEAIDRVHRMPDYMRDLLQRTAKPGQLPFERSMSRVRAGGYWQLSGDGAKKIGIDLDQDETAYAAGEDLPHPQLTTIHEVAHFLDNVLFGDPQTGALASAGWGARVGPMAAAVALDQQFGDVIVAMRESTDYQALAGQNLTLFRVEGMPGQLFSYPARAAYRVRNPVEMFARGYSQWIALRSGNSTLRAQIDYRNEMADRGVPRLQWQWDNFEPIAGAYDRLFRAAGLLRSTP